MILISPSEATDFQFCQKYWYNKRHLGLVPRDISFKDLAAYMGITVGEMVEGWIQGEDISVQKIEDTIAGKLQEQYDLGRQLGFGVENHVEKLGGMVAGHFDKLVSNTGVWMEDCTIVGCETVLEDWGNARTDILLEHKNGYLIIVDLKCKYSKNTETFTISRDIDLWGNQSMLYPIAISQKYDKPVEYMRFVYCVEGKLPQVFEQRMNRSRQLKWLQMYGQTVKQIRALNKNPCTIPDLVLENPYHTTPWGYRCEFANYCLEGEHPQAAVHEFIQVERKKK